MINKIRFIGILSVLSAFYVNGMYELPDSAKEDISKIASEHIKVHLNPTVHKECAVTKEIKRPIHQLKIDFSSPTVPQNILDRFDSILNDVDVEWQESKDWLYCYYDEDSNITYYCDAESNLVAYIDESNDVKYYCEFDDNFNLMVISKIEILKNGKTFVLDIDSYSFLDANGRSVLTPKYTFQGKQEKK